MKRPVLVLITALLVLGGTAAGVMLMYPVEEPVGTKDPRTLPPLVKLASAKTPETASRAFTGTVAARVESNLGFRVSGKIAERLVDVGDTVKAGQLLMRMDDADLRLAVTGKRNAVAAANATFIQAKADERRYAALVKDGVAAVSPQRYEQAKAAYDAAGAQLAAAEAEAQVAENEVSYTLLTADADGTIVETIGEPGQVVSAGQPILRMAKAGPREAVIWFPETLRPRNGVSATARLYGSDTPTKAVLRQISDAADPQTRTYETRWVLEGEAASAPLGSTVTVSLTNNDVARHAEIPVGALLDDGTRTGVWIFYQKTSSVGFRLVEVERLGEESVTVTGLTAGEDVVALGAHLLRDGMVVRTMADIAEAKH